MKTVIQSLLFCSILALSCNGRVSKIDQSEKQMSATAEARQQQIVEEHLVNGAWKLPLYSRERQAEIDRGLAKDSTIAYLWQQKSMPLFKQGKYEIGMAFVDKAVKYDPDRWQDYRAYIKCIFAKTYREAIDDFIDCRSKFGNRMVMDHSYNFYIGLSFLQLNEFEKAEKHFKMDHDSIMNTHGTDRFHHLDLFYYGICKYEICKDEEALKLFDQALKLYPQFSDALYYKACCLRRKGEADSAATLFATAEANARKGYTINEDGSVYERYPYQVRWN